MSQVEIWATTPGALLDKEQAQAASNILSCRTIDLGGRVVYCPKCHTHTVLYNPCNQRGCPNCSKKNQAKWNRKMHAKILPMGHYHLIVSLPEEMNTLWLIDRRQFISSFFHAVDLGFKNMCKESGITPGVILVFQSHSVGLAYKPHMHCIVTDGGVNAENDWFESYPSMKYSIICDTVRETLLPHFIKKLSGVKRNTVRFETRNCQDREYTVYPAIHKFNGDNIVDYLSKSICGFISDIEDIDFDNYNNTATIYERYRGETRKTVLSMRIFRERYFNHVPPKGTVTIRNYGLYSNRQVETLERIRVEELGGVKEIIDDEETCPECDTPLETIDVFGRGKPLPLIVRLYLSKYCWPPGHGQLLGIA